LHKALKENIDFDQRVTMSVCKKKVGRNINKVKSTVTCIKKEHTPAHINLYVCEFVCGQQTDVDSAGVKNDKKNSTHTLKEKQRESVSQTERESGRKSVITAEFESVNRRLEVGLRSVTH